MRVLYHRFLICQAFIRFEAIVSKLSIAMSNLYGYAKGFLVPRYFE